jgi:hypothetical protein
VFGQISTFRYSEHLLGFFQIFAFSYIELLGYLEATYEQEYLVHAIIQVLIYSLALHLDPFTLQLRVLVFFSKTAEAVLYESDIISASNFLVKIGKVLL